MEPRPNRPSKPSSKRTRPQTQEPWTPPEPGSGQDAADIYVQPSSGSSGGPWYGPRGSLGPEPAEYQNARPPMPIKPKGERGHKWLKYLFGALLLALIVGGSAFAITKFLDRDDGKSDAPVVAAITPTTDPAQAAQSASPTQQAEPTLAPTEESAPQPTEEANPPAEPTQAADESDGNGDGESVDSASAADSGLTEVQTSSSLIPAPSNLQGDWIVTDEGERSKAEVGAQLGDNGEALLDQWSWQENIYSDLTRTSPGEFPDDTTFLSISVHEFGTEEGASQATQYLADIVVSAQGLEEVPDVTIGDETRALAGPGDSVNLYVLYVRDGRFLIRLGGASATGDPAPFVNSVAQNIVNAQ